MQAGCEDEEAGAGGGGGGVADVCHTMGPDVVVNGENEVTIWRA